MEVSELLTIVREDYLDDTFNGWETATQEERDEQFLWSDKALLRYLTEAQRQACNRTNFLHSDDSSISKIKFKAGVSSYTFDMKINVIEEVNYNGKKVTHISKEERNRFLPSWRDASGIGTNRAFYTVRGRTITFYPTPDGTDVNGIAYLSVWHQPLDPIASATDELVIPEEYHRDLIWWMLYEAYSKQDADGYDKERGLMYLSQFNEAFGGYIPSEVRLNQLQEPEDLGTRPVNYLYPSRDENEWYN